MRANAKFTRLLPDKVSDGIIDNRRDLVVSVVYVWNFLYIKCTFFWNIFLYLSHDPNIFKSMECSDLSRNPLNQAQNIEATVSSYLTYIFI